MAIGINIAPVKMLFVSHRQTRPDLDNRAKPARNNGGQRIYVKLAVYVDSGFGNCEMTDCQGKRYCPY